jgi:hypothetical protein
MLDGRAQPERSGRLASHAPAPRSVGKLIPHGLACVAGDVDERWVERHDRTYGVVDASDIAAATRRDDLDADERTCGVREVLDDLQTALRSDVEARV